MNPLLNPARELAKAAHFILENLQTSTPVSKEDLEVFGSRLDTLWLAIAGQSKLPTASAVAREFCRELRDILTVNQLTHVIERNLAETDANVCHSHDFCDANVVMERAFLALGIDPSNTAPRDESGCCGMSEACVDIWNDAWNLAKGAQFDPQRVA